MGVWAGDGVVPGRGGIGGSDGTGLGSGGPGFGLVGSGDSGRGDIVLFLRGGLTSVVLRPFFGLLGPNVCLLVIKLVVLEGDVHKYLSLHVSICRSLID